MKKIKVKVCAVKMARVDENGLIAYFEEKILDENDIKNILEVKDND